VDAALLSVPVFLSAEDLVAALSPFCSAWRLAVPVAASLSLPSRNTSLLILGAGVFSAVLLVWSGLTLVNSASPSRLCSGRE
jgi:hypothetical protein